MSAAHTPYLTPEQVSALNEKHGWFHYGDAQSDVSRAFAQDAIAMHERMRTAAAQMLAALVAANAALNYVLNNITSDLPHGVDLGKVEMASACVEQAIAAATGEKT